MRVSIAHCTRLDYGDDVIEGVMDVRLGPLSDDHQRWLTFELNAAPNASVGRYSDGFGNAAHLVTLRRPHRFLEVVSRGEVETLLDDPFALPLRSPMPLMPAEQVEYLLPSALVPADPRLAQLAAPFRPSADDEAFNCVAALMRLVFDGFAYETRVTDVTTSVGEVLDDRRGVCQDFAHVLIGLCRAIDVPTGRRRLARVSRGVHTHPRLARLRSDE